MNRIIKAAAIAAIAGIGVIGTASAASAANPPTISWTGNGFNGAGTLNNVPSPVSDGGTGQFAHWDADGSAVDANDGYLLWVLTANGATSATIHLPDGDHTMIKVGGTFKFASEYFSKAQLTGDASATYTGTAKNVQLTVSHGQVGFDTNVPSGVTWDGQTGTGTVGKDALGDITDPSFTVEKASHTETWWASSNGGQYHRDQDVRNRYDVTATPILGDETGNVVGWSLKLGGYSASLGGGYSGPPVGYIDDGGAFTGFLGHVQTVTDVLKMNGATLQSKVVLQSDTRPTL